MASWKLKTKFYDDSDPSARTRISDILKLRKVTLSTLYTELPVTKFKRDKVTGEVIGIRLKGEPVVEPAVQAVIEAGIESDSTEIEEVELENQEVSEEIPDDLLDLYSKPVRGRPKKPIDRDDTVRRLYDAKEASRKANDTIAKCYEDLMPLSNQKTLKKESIPLWLKTRLWRKQYSKSEIVQCPICSDTMISSTSFSAGHILPESKGGSIHMENLMPICCECNSQMGTHHLYWFAWHYYGRTFWPL